MFGISAGWRFARPAGGRAVFAQTDRVVGKDKIGLIFISAAMRRALRAYSLNIRKVAP